MIYKEMVLNEAKSATLTAYIHDKEISYGVNRKRPAILICPGGGYLMHATKEGEAVAMAFLAKGYHCFVLRYTTLFKTRRDYEEKSEDVHSQAAYPIQVLELMHAMHQIHLHAQEWQVDCEQLFAIGFSAGSHVVGSLATRWNDESLLKQLDFVPRPEELKLTGALLSYPLLQGNLEEFSAQHQPESLYYDLPYVYRCLFNDPHPDASMFAAVDLKQYISSSTVPIFLWHSIDDTYLDPMDSTTFIHALQASGVPCEYHLFSHGGHGLALANAFCAKQASDMDEAVAMWFTMATYWMAAFRKGEPFTDC